MYRSTIVAIPMLLLAGVAQSANGNIIHTLVNETFDLPNGALENWVAFDLTQDGLNDFEIGLAMYPDPGGTEPTAWGIGFRSQGAEIQNFVGMSFGSIRYSTGDTIRPESSSAFGSVLYGPFGSIAYNGSILDPMPSDSGGIYALRMMIDAQEHFGWVRIDYQGPWSEASVTVRDFAFSTVAETPILAGQVPAPGSVGVLVLAGLVWRRRRS